MLIDNAMNHVVAVNMETTKQNMNNWIVPAYQMLVVLGDKIVSQFGDYSIAETLYKHAQQEVSKLNGVLSTPQFSAVGAAATTKARSASARVASEKAAKAEQERKAKIEAYWAEHAEEKQALEAESAECSRRADALEEELAPYRRKVDECKRRRNNPNVYNTPVSDLSKKISAKESQLAGLGLFQGKQKKAIQAELEQMKVERAGLEAEVRKQREQIIADCSREEASLKAIYGGRLEALDKERQRIRDIEKELTRDR